MMNEEKNLGKQYTLKYEEYTEFRFVYIRIDEMTIKMLIDSKRK